jgi:hypothetical protein
MVTDNPDQSPWGSKQSRRGQIFSKIIFSDQPFKMKSTIMSLRAKLAFVVLSLLLLTSSLISPPALAVTQIELTDLSYYECPPEIGKGTVTSGGPIMRLANCFIITGTTINKSGKIVMDADVFGRIYDVNNNSAMENRGRLGAIDVIEPGTGTFELRVSVPEALETPLKLEQFKASGFTSKVR